MPSLLAFDIIRLSISSLVIFVISGFLLLFLSKIFKLSNQSFKTAFLIAIIVGLAEFILKAISGFALNLISLITISQFVFVTFLLAFWLIKKSYGIDWGKSFLIWIIWTIARFVITTFFVFLILSLAGPR